MLPMANSGCQEMTEAKGSRKVPAICSSVVKGTGGETEGGRDTQAPYPQLLVVLLTFVTESSDSVFDGIAFPEGLEHTDTS